MPSHEVTLYVLAQCLWDLPGPKGRAARAGPSPFSFSLRRKRKRSWMPKEKEWGRSLDVIASLVVGPEGPHTRKSRRHWAAPRSTMLRATTTPQTPRPTLSTHGERGWKTCGASGRPRPIFPYSRRGGPMCPPADFGHTLRPLPRAPSARELSPQATEGESPPGDAATGRCPHRPVHRTSAVAADVGTNVGADRCVRAQAPGWEHPCQHGGEGVKYP